MSADTAFKSLAELLLVAISNLKRDIPIVRRDLLNAPDSDDVLSNTEECLDKLQAGMNRIGTLNVDQIAELIFIATSTLIELRKWMYISYRASPASSSLTEL